jgi:IrrE N-terminal-like domain
MTNQRRSPTKEAIALTSLWQNFGPASYPIDLELVIERLVNGRFDDQSIKISYESLSSIEGILKRDPKNLKLWHLIVNSDAKKRNRNRFTLAHELGHFICHRDLSDSFEDTSDSINDFVNEIEEEANLFAAWLLMPANLVRSEFDQEIWCSDTLLKMKDRFGSSQTACARRLIDSTTRPRAFVVSRDGMILWSKKSSQAPYMTAFKSGDELPQGSCAMRCYETQIPEPPSPVKNIAWHIDWLAQESHYLDTIGKGYQYTCIEFERNSYSFDAHR